MENEDPIQSMEAFARLDLARKERCGVPEIVYGAGKTTEQVVEIVQQMVQKLGRALVSRVEPAMAQVLSLRLEPALTVEHYALARCVVARRSDASVKLTGGVIAVFAAGTSDIPIAEEACLVAEQMGCEVLRFNDVGVAGLHRLVEPLRQVLQRDVAAVVAVAGMEGALPTVLRGLLPMPVIGVPTSVGYGLGRPGEAALMTMLHSCAPGLTVVNIDNGVGAGATAALIANRACRAKLR